MKNKIEKNAKLLLSSDLIHVITNLFIDTFLVAYFLNISNENLTIISLYYIVVFTARLIGNFLIGYVVKKYPPKRNYILSIGIALRAVFILIIVLLAEKITNHFILIALLYALSETFYWCSHEVIYIDVTTTNNRKKYMATKKILSKLVNIIAPIILGTSIELYSFIKIAIYIFILSLIQIILTILIKPKINANNIEKFSFNNLLKEIENKKLNKINNYKLAGISYGFIENLITTLITIITIMTFKTTFNLGILTAVFAIISTITLILYSKYYNKRNAIFLLTFCAMIVIISVTGLLIEIKQSTLIIYNFAYIIAYSIYDVIYNTRKGNLVNECNIEKYKVEFIVYASSSILIGRILGYILMFIVSFSTNIIIFKILLAIFTFICVPIYSMLIYKSEFTKK